MLAGDLADTHAKLNALVRSVGDERERAEESRSLVGELRQELAAARHPGAQAPPAATARPCRPTRSPRSSG